MHNLDRNTFRSSGTVVYACDLGGNITFLNHEGERLSGYSREEACQMNISQVVDPEFAGDFHAQALREARARVGSVHEIDVIAKDGRRIPLEVSTRVILRDDKRIEIQGIGVLSERNQLSSSTGLRCVDEAFCYGNLTDQVG